MDCINFDLMKNLTEDSQNSLLIIKSMVSKDAKIDFMYQLIVHIDYYNKIRFTIFEKLIERFVKPVIDKGIRDEQKKILFETNYAEFESFLQRKIRYWIHSLFLTNDFNHLIVKHNEKLIAEIIHNSEQHIKSKDIEIENLNEINNKYIAESNLSDFPILIVNYILNNDNYKEQILSYFNEFLNYLIVF